MKQDEESIDAVCEAYGWLWHVISDDQRVHAARHLLRGLLDKDEIHWGINKAKEEGAEVNVPRATMNPEDASDMLRLVKTVKYLIGIAEMGEGRKIGREETAEKFLLEYVQRLEGVVWPMLAEADRNPFCPLGHFVEHGPSNTIIQHLRAARESGIRMREAEHEERDLAEAERKISTVRF